MDYVYSNARSIIRGHSNRFNVSHNQKSREFLEAVLKNEPDWENGRDDGEAFEGTPIKPYLNNELDLIQDSIINNYNLIF